MKRLTYFPQGTCSRVMEVSASEDNRIIDVIILGGCNGNLQGLSRLLRGMHIDDAVTKLQGIRCGAKPTSCPDQLARALAALKTQESK